MTHTPGPWRVDLPYKNDIISDLGGICSVPPQSAIGMTFEIAGPLASDDETAYANAHLIAAAPDLLAALEAFADLLGYEDPIDADDKVTVASGPTTDYSIKGSNILAARAAIAKARNTPAFHIEVL